MAEQKPGWKSIKHGGVTDAGSSREFKTGDWRAKFPVHSEKKCTHCLICTVYCPDDCILVKEGKIDKFDYDYCKGCGICAQVCPVKAIHMENETDFDDYQKNPEKYLDDEKNEKEGE